MPEEAAATARASETIQHFEENNPQSARWQLKLLPLMMAMLAGLTVTFTLANIWEIRSIQRHIENTDSLDLRPLVSESVPSTNVAGTPNLSFENRISYVQWQVAAILEADAINRRYHQASTVLLTRTYIVFIGFTTGMVLALVGATFILGKLRESSSKAEIKSEFLKMSLLSASPGLMLAAMGTSLILATIFVRSDVNVTDGPLYLTPSGVTVSVLPSPQSLVAGTTLGNPKKQNVTGIAGAYTVEAGNAEKKATTSFPVEIQGGTASYSQGATNPSLPPSQAAPTNRQPSTRGLVKPP
jgi:hypothetical protein